MQVPEVELRPEALKLLAPKRSRLLAKIRRCRPERLNTARSQIGLVDFWEDTREVELRAEESMGGAPKSSRPPETIPHSLLAKRRPM